MIEQLAFLWWPFLGLLVVAALHVYLGFHVVEREVIFVDLALAQIAVLGAALATLFGHDPFTLPSYALALAFALGGAAVFAWTRSEEERVPQEAIIGIAYAVSAAATVLILNRAVHGAEHLREALVGQLLAIGPAQVVQLAALYAVLGVLHWSWRTSLLAVTRDAAAARAAGLRVRAWDFAFYASFGVTVTASVALCGVLVVFTYLVIPNVWAMLVARGTAARLAVAWAVAAFGSAAGMLASIALEAPPGASVVVAFGLLLALVVPFRRRLRRA